jgi:hypothetical protein
MEVRPMANPITLVDLKIGSDHFVIELIDSSVTITWPKQPLSISEKRFPEVAASLTRSISSAAMKLARHKAGRAPRGRS